MPVTIVVPLLPRIVRGRPRVPAQEGAVVTGLLVLAGTSLLVPGLLLVLAPRRRFLRAAALWLVWPVLLFLGCIAFEMLTRAPVANPLGNALLGLSLVSALLLVPWLIISAIVVAFAFLVRRLLRGDAGPPARGGAADATAQLGKGNATGRATLPDAEPLWQVSPDRTIRVELAPVEWINSDWIEPARVFDLVTNELVLDLWGSDWDISFEFPAPRQVLLHGQRHGLQHRGVGLRILLDLSVKTYRIQRQWVLDGPPACGPLGRIRQALDDASRRAPAATGHRDPATRSWRAALGMLLGMAMSVAAIALVTRAQEQDEASGNIITTPAGGFRPR